MAGPIDIGFVKRKHKDFLALQKSSIWFALSSSGYEAAEYVKTSSKFKNRSGARSLKNSTKYRIQQRGNESTLSLSWAKSYALFVDKGTRPHAITAKKGPFLRFMSGGKWRFARSVWHPGTKATNFAKIAQLTAYQTLGKELEKRMAELSSKF